MDLTEGLKNDGTVTGCDGIRDCATECGKLLRRLYMTGLDSALSTEHERPAECQLVGMSKGV